MASSFARFSLLYLQVICSLSVLKLYESAQENLGLYLFFLVTDGTCVLEYQGVCWQLRAGTVRLLTAERDTSCVRLIMWMNMGAMMHFGSFHGSILMEFLYRQFVTNMWNMAGNWCFHVWKRCNLVQESN